MKRKEKFGNIDRVDRVDRVDKSIYRRYRLYRVLFFSLLAPLARADLHLRAGVIETGNAAVRGKPLDLPQGAGEFLWLVAFGDDVGNGERERLERAGVRVLGYVPDNGFLIRGAAGALARAAEVPGVAWSGRYKAHYKLDPALREGDDAVVVGADVFQPSAFGLQPYTHTQALAESEDVVWVGRAPRFELLNDTSRTQPMMDVNRAWDFMGLRGEGEILAIADTGLDTGDTNTLHPDFFGRVTGYAWARPTWEALVEHGTLVAGCAVGDGSSRPDRLYAGVAPKARLLFHSVMDSGGGYGGMNYLDDMIEQSFADGARVFSFSMANMNSHGQYDDFAEFIDGCLWRYPELLFCCGAGNDGPGAGTVLSPATAKNVVAVAGASKTDGNTRQGIWKSSARGPCLDGRVKPDIAAPCENITSTTPNSTYLTAAGGYTSFSTPYAAGCALLARQWLREERGIADPSAALVKAILLNGAQTLAPGASGEVPSTRPNNAEGWGHVSLFASLHTPPGTTNRLHDAKTGLHKHGMDVYGVASQPGVRIHAMLVYTDYPKCPSAAKALVNDLDLEVVAPDGTVTAANNRLDNVERISFEPSLPGVYQVAVRGRRVPFGPQPYALVMRGEPLAPNITSLRVETNEAVMTFFSRRDTPHELLTSTNLVDWTGAGAIPANYRDDPARVLSTPVNPNEPKRFWTLRHGD